jgi:hypothetical protein
METSQLAISCLFFPPTFVAFYHGHYKLGSSLGILSSFILLQFHELKKLMPPFKDYHRVEILNVVHFEAFFNLHWSKCVISFIHQVNNFNFFFAQIFKKHNDLVNKPLHGFAFSSPSLPSIIHKMEFEW